VLRIRDVYPGSDFFPSRIQHWLYTPGSWSWITDPPTLHSFTSKSYIYFQLKCNLSKNLSRSTTILRCKDWFMSIYHKIKYFMIVVVGGGGGRKEGVAFR